MVYIDPIHPGEILKEEFLDPLGISIYKLAKDINVPLNRLTEIIKGKRRISAETALLLSRYFRLSDNFWFILQARHDEKIAKIELKEILDKIHPYNYSQNDYNRINERKFLE